MFHRRVDVRPQPFARASIQTAAMLPGARPEPTSTHLPMRPGWRCRVCGTPWPCADQRADLGAAIRAGHGRAVGFMLTSNVAAAWLDQPDACPGCLVGQFVAWIDEDLWGLIIAEPADATSTALDGPPTRDRTVDRRSGIESRRTFPQAAHVPGCGAAVGTGHAFRASGVDLDRGGELG